MAWSETTGVLEKKRCPIAARCFAAIIVLVGPAAPLWVDVSPCTFLVCLLSPILLGDSILRIDSTDPRLSSKVSFWVVPIRERVTGWIVAVIHGTPRRPPRVDVGGHRLISVRRMRDHLVTPDQIIVDSGQLWDRESRVARIRKDV